MEEPSEVRSADACRLISGLRVDPLHSDKLGVDIALQSDRGSWQMSHWIIFMVTALCCSWHTFSPAFLVPVSECISFDLHTSPSSTENGINSTFHSFTEGSSSNNVSIHKARTCFTQLMTSNCSGGNYSSTSVVDHIIVKCTPQQDDEISDTLNEKIAFYGTTYLVATAKSVYMLGSFVAAVLFRPLVNRYGQRRTVFLYFLLFYLCSIATFLTDSMGVFLIFRFLLSFGITSVYWITLHTMLESVVEDYRLVYGVIGYLGWAIGYMTLPVISWFTIDWFSFQASVSVPSLLLVVPLWFLPESVNFLLRRGRISDAICVLKVALKKNEQNVDDLTELCHQTHQNLMKRSRESKENLFLRLKAHLGYRYLLFYASSFTISVLYYILSWNFYRLPGDPFVTFAWSGAMETLAVLLIMSFGYFVSQNLLLLLMSMGASIFPLTGILVATGEVWVPSYSYMAAKFFVTGAVVLIVIRGFEESCFVVIATVISIGGALAPFLDQMVVDDYSPMLMTAECTLCLIFGILSALFPLKTSTCSQQHITL